MASIRRILRTLGLLICGAGAISPVHSCLLAQRVHQPSKREEESLNRFLQAYLKDPVLGDVKSTRYSFGFVDLRDDGTQEVIVYLMDDDGSYWCGTGGCTMLVLAPAGASYKVVTQSTITRPPIRVLATKSHGWHDIAVQVGGGGIREPYEARLPFDGKTYPSNPAVPPARPLRHNVRGKIVISWKPESQTIPLYP